MSNSLNVFPDEIIQHILEYLPPENTLRCFQLVSRRSCRIANEPTLWKHYCRTSFKYWRPDHGIPQKIQVKEANVDWKSIFIERKRTNHSVAKILDGILSTKVRRNQRIGYICQQGYDAKDFLLQQCRVDDDAEDALARRYFSNIILDSIHRSVALSEWGRAPIYDERPSVHELAMGYRKKRLERLLGAFDMFFIRQDERDIDGISHELDMLAKIFIRFHPGFDEKPIRQKALLLNSWLRMYDFTGMTSISQYRHLSNCLIGHALSEQQHNSLPVISTAIFVSLAHRLGIPAAPCAFPSHVHALVSRTTLDGLDGPPTTPLDRDTDMMMYLDPFGSNQEVSKEDLREKLITMGWDGSSAIPYLRPTSDHEVVLRVAQNIRASCSAALDWSSRPTSTGENPFSKLEYGRNVAPRNTATIRDMAMYTTLWSAALMVPADVREDWADLLLGVLNMVMSDWEEDVWMVEKYLGPLFDRHRRCFSRHRLDSEFRDVWAWCDHVQQADKNPVVVTRRDDLTWTRVRYRIGDVVRHKRFGFVGIIFDWSYGSAPEGDGRFLGWEAGNVGNVGFDSGPYSDMVPYYSCLRDSDTPKFVAREQNVEPVVDPKLVPLALVRMAGKYFKRFDRDNCVFISNIRERYPDD
ncbi:uncharacterized protein MKZ38_007479 [Zalerion maritima]|uniref:F-box domain-containing protein n=1 Tax=Zalerion maritima TaxID=339359 RepID=A0AAD5RVK4_9PEZI|nr:uncharacterized protein MKZ38_007479 [Zalerion maritima]